MQNVRPAITTFETQDGRNNKGSVLIFCLGVLALLSLLATAILFTAKSEEKSATAYLNEAKAQCAAESGVEYAIAKLSDYSGSLTGIPAFIEAPFSTPNTPLKYLKASSFGNYDRDGDGLSELAGYISETYREKGDNYRLRVQSCQSKLNINDSNEYLNVDTDPYEDQRFPERDYSAIPAHLQHPSGKDPDWAYKPESWIYFSDPDVDGDGDIDQNDATKVVEENIDINGTGVGDMDDVILISDLIAAGFDPVKSQNGLPHPKARGRLELIFENLVKELFPAVDAGKTANMLFRNRLKRPGNRFDHFDQVLEILVPKCLDGNQFEILKGYLTLHSWQDNNVINPTFQWAISRPPQLLEIWLGDHPLSPLMRTAFGVTGFDNTYPARPQFNEVTNSSLNSWDIYLHSDAQTKYFQTGVRSPIDINNAPLPLLKALMAPLKGWYLKEAPEEGEAPRAEDFSRPLGANGMFGAIGENHCWDFSGGKLYLESWPDYSDGINPGPQFDTNGLQLSLKLLPKSLYYYESENAEAWMHGLGSYAAPGDPQFQLNFKEKNERMGELLELALSKVLSEALAQKLHARIHGAGFKPFRTFEELQNYLHSCADALSVEHISGFSPVMADMVIANFNPNSRINDYNPNKSLRLTIDKSKLSAHSTEFCFSPLGFFSMESLGEVCAADGKTTADSQATVLVKTHEIFRLSSQNQFLKGYNPADGVDGKNFFSESQNIQGTFGAEAGYSGNSLQSYPEPEKAGENLIKDSGYDGYLMLSVIQPERGEFFYGNSATSFLADYRGTLNASYASGEVAPGGLYALPAEAQATSSLDATGRWIERYGHLPSRYKNNTTVLLPVWTRDTKAMSPRNTAASNSLSLALPESSSWKIPGCLYPDGALSDAERALKYASRNMGEVPDDTANPAPNLFVDWPACPGETLVKGSTYTIKWRTNSTGNIKLGYVDSGGSIQSWIAPNAPSAPIEGSFEWTPASGLDTTFGKSAISMNHINHGITLQSDKFTLYPSNVNFPDVWLLYPRGWKMFQPGAKINVTWASGLGGNIDIKLFKPNVAGVPSILVTTINTANDGSEDFDLPANLEDGTYIFKLVNTEDTTKSDYAEPFSVVSEPFVKVLSPAGGEDFVTGSTQVRWETNIPWHYVNVDLYKGGQWVNRLFHGKDPSTHACNFNVAAYEPGDDYKIRVTSLAGDTIMDESDTAFSIGHAGFSPTSSQKGSLMFWVKPNFDTAHSNRIRQLFSLSGETLPYPAVPNQYPGVPEGSLIHKKFKLYYFSHGGAKIDPIVESTIPIYDPDLDLNGAWLPTRSLFMHTTLGGAGTRRIATNTCNASWKSAVENCPYNFEGRQWNHMAIAWDFVGTPPDTAPARVLNLAVNGQSVEAVNEYSPDWQDNSGNPRFNHDNPYVSFGCAGSDSFRNEAADSTYGVIVSVPEVLGDDLLKDDYLYGRYSPEANATYTSPEFDLWKDLDLSADTSLRLSHAQWTAYWPGDANTDYSAAHPRFNHNRKPGFAMTEWDYVNVERYFGAEGRLFYSLNLFNPSANNWLYPNTLGGKLALDPAAGEIQDSLWRNSNLRWKAGDKFRFSFAMHLSESQTLTDSPVLDDITFVFQMSQAKILSWSEE